MEILTGKEPAYPVHGGENDDPRNHTLQGGLTIREQFAMVAMQGLLANGVANPPDVARQAVLFTDALIAELNKKNN